MKKTIVHLITGLSKGGAETMLYQLLKFRADSSLQYRVISLGGGQYYETPMRELGYEVSELNLRKQPIRSFVRLCREIKGTDTLCCWMYHANFIGYIAGRIAGVKRIVWCIRHSDLNPEHNKARTLRINRICARWSKNVSAVIYNGNQARAAHEASGYCRAKGFVADNGCDCDEYRPDAAAAESLRKELGIPADKRMILSVTKATPIKDIPTFFRAFGTLRKRSLELAAVLCGPSVEAANPSIAALCRETGLRVNEDVYLLGMRHDVPRLLAACGLYVLHSAGEAFPNALLQAMACGCLCVTTDVGDARRILADDDCVVPPEDPTALAEKMAEMLALPKAAAEKMRGKSRARVCAEFDIRKIAGKYEELFRG